MGDSAYIDQETNKDQAASDEADARTKPKNRRALQKTRPQTRSKTQQSSQEEPEEPSEQESRTPSKPTQVTAPPLTRSKSLRAQAKNGHTVRGEVPTDEPEELAPVTSESPLVPPKQVPEEKARLKQGRLKSGPKSKKEQAVGKKRRSNDEIVKTFFCKFDGCNKAYASYAAAGHHYRQKHQITKKDNLSEENEYTEALHSSASETTRWPSPLLTEFPTPSAWEAKHMSFMPKKETICSYVYLHHTRQRIFSLVAQAYQHPGFYVLSEILKEQLVPDPSKRRDEGSDPKKKKKKSETEESSMSIDQDEPSSKAVPVSAEPVEVAFEAEISPTNYRIVIHPEWENPPVSGHDKSKSSKSSEDKHGQHFLEESDGEVAHKHEDGHKVFMEEEDANGLDGDSKERHNIKLIGSFTELKKRVDLAELTQLNPLFEFKLQYLETFLKSEKEAINRLIANLEEVQAANTQCFSLISGLFGVDGSSSLFQLFDFNEYSQHMEGLLDKRIGLALEMMLASPPICKRDVLNVWIVSPRGEYYPSYERQESLAFFCNLIPKQITAALSNWRMRHKSLVEVYDQKVFIEEPPLVVQNFMETEPTEKHDSFHKLLAIIANFSYLKKIHLDDDEANQIVEVIINKLSEFSSSSTDQSDQLFLQLFYELSKEILTLHLLSWHRATRYVAEYMRVICETEPEHLPLTSLHNRLTIGEQTILMRPTDITEKTIPRKIFSHKHFSAKSVNYLKTWLKINVDDPYPTKKEYTKLAEGTGLSESQVRDWFVNARRRLIDGPRPVPQTKSGKKKGETKRKKHMDVDPEDLSSDLDDPENTLRPSKRARKDPSTLSSRDVSSPSSSSRGDGSAEDDQDTLMPPPPVPSRQLKSDVGVSTRKRNQEILKKDTKSEEIVIVPMDVDDPNTITIAPAAQVGTPATTNSRKRGANQEAAPTTTRKETKRAKK